MAAAQIVWFRNDLRLADQAAVRAAAAAGPVVAAYVLDDATPGAWRIGAAQRWWLHHSLAALAVDLKRMGGTPRAPPRPAGRGAARDRRRDRCHRRPRAARGTSLGPRRRKPRSPSGSTSTCTTARTSRRRAR